MATRRLARGQTCSVHIASVGPEGADTSTVLTTGEILLEAPNWSLDGTALILNADGVLWRILLATGELTHIDIDVSELNNDHVLDPDGEHVFVSANDGHIYRASLAGGAAHRVTEDDGGLLHFLHGVSPDGGTLAFAGIERDGESWGAANVFSERPGHAQIARMRPDGSGVEQLTFDARVNWFPHLAAGARAAGAPAMYVSFPPRTLGHPADVEGVRMMVVDDDWTNLRLVAELSGGQGTANVHNWSPDGSRFAYVSYSRPSVPAGAVHI